MKNLNAEKSFTPSGFGAASNLVKSKRKSQIHFEAPTDLYKQLQRIKIVKDLTIGEMFNDMLVKYLKDNSDCLR